MPILSLQNKPGIKQAGVSVHGQVAHESYCLPTLWCLHLYQYAADIRVGGTHLSIKPGCITLFPPGAQLDYQYRGHSRHLYAHFHLEDEPEQGRPFELLTDNPRSFPDLLEQMYEVIRRFSIHPLRADILFWDLLWKLESLQPGHEPEHEPLHPVFVKAREQIELGLGHPLSIRKLAGDLKISHNQLTRIFRSETGDTVAAYIQMRRAKRAGHLLRDTNLPIKSIGFQVGYPDPHHFNKFVHRAFGCSPSAFRENRALRHDSAQTG